jgi:pyruvate kinase
MAQIRKTKIVATLGPSSESIETVKLLVAAGMDVARLNFSHGSHEEHRKRAERVREAEEEFSRPLAIIADLQGPKLRLSKGFPGRRLMDNEVVTVCDEGQSGDLTVTPGVISKVIAPGQKILIDDGLVQLDVMSVSNGIATCIVLIGGEVRERKGVCIPGVALPIPSLTGKDLSDLECALSCGCDYIALSFVQTADDVHALRKHIESFGSEARIVSKIEQAEALNNLESIVQASDAIMVARGDLGVELGVEQVPIAQKRIIWCSRSHGKPVITATQMLDSMTHRPEATRAEASDIANAILDGTSAVMLSGETANGKYPIEALSTMNRVALAIESSGHLRPAPVTEAPHRYSVSEAVADAACTLAADIDAPALIVPTITGTTVSYVKSKRPTQPIIAVSPNLQTLRRLALFWGVVPLFSPKAQTMELLRVEAIDAALEKGYLKLGDEVVLISGRSANVAGSTNMVTVETVGEPTS